MGKGSLRAGHRDAAEAMQDKAIAPEDLRNAIESLQQAIFSLGSTLYQQTEQDDEAVDFEVDMATEYMEETTAQPSNEAEDGINHADLDATLTADYEAID